VEHSYKEMLVRRDVVKVKTFQFKLSINGFLIGLQELNLIIAKSITKWSLILFSMLHPHYRILILKFLINGIR